MNIHVVNKQHDHAFEEPPRKKVKTLPVQIVPNAGKGPYR